MYFTLKPSDISFSEQALIRKWTQLVIGAERGQSGCVVTTICWYHLVCQVSAPTLEQQLRNRRSTPRRNRIMPSKLDKMLVNIENEQLLDVTSQQEELIRAKDVAKRQASIEEQERKSTEWRWVSAICSIAFLAAEVSCVTLCNSLHRVVSQDYMLFCMSMPCRLWIITLAHAADIKNWRWEPTTAESVIFCSQCNSQLYRIECISSCTYVYM